MTMSDSVLDLVRTVGKLPPEDQDRILRVVSLMSCAPRNIQQNSRRMLHALISEEPASRLACVAELEVIINYLETSRFSEPH